MANETKNSKDKRHFWKDFRAELKRVIWPTPKQLINNTVAVISIVLLTAVIVFVLDLSFEFITKNGINGLRKMVVQTENSIEENNNQTNTNTVENNSTTQDNNVIENSTSIDNNTNVDGEGNIAE